MTESWENFRWRPDDRRALCKISPSVIVFNHLSRLVLMLLYQQILGRSWAIIRVIFALRIQGLSMFSFVTISGELKRQSAGWEVEERLEIRKFACLSRCLSCGDETADIFPITLFSVHVSNVQNSFYFSFNDMISGRLVFRVCHVSLFSNKGSQLAVFYAV